MSQRERQRYHLLKMVLDKRITLRDASEGIGVCYRHAKRLKRSIKLHGASGIVHGNRGRASPRRLDQALKDRIIELSEDCYGNFNDTHFTEKLNEIEGICVSRETVRKLRRACGIKGGADPKSTTREGLVRPGKV